jgi:S-adenosylmethionine:tRNA ribosyltransferase-isomerase
VAGPGVPAAEAARLLRVLDYELPAELIAQHPAARREDSRLLVVERASGALTDARFAELGRWLRAGDALVVNETRVRPARLVLRRPSGGRVELLFVRPAARAGPADAWRVLARPAKHAGPGARLTTPDGALEVEVTAAGEQGERVVRVVRGALDEVLRAQGELPLPPYIRRAPDAGDAERYQTVYARVEGAVAAPTAGLHFSEALLATLEAAGVRRAAVTLHVGPGTFRPVTAADPREHEMEEEWYEVGEAAARGMRDARAGAGRIVAVGTTTVRALESMADAHDGAIATASGWTRKYILPPYRFRAVDVLLTNFHLPRTTLLLLVAAFAGEERLRAAYAHAIRERYRFYSYGDAMLVV